MLTAKQHATLVFIEGAIEQTGGICPSYEEIMAGLHLKSKSMVSHRLNKLEERGFIRRLPNRARSIEILKPTKLNTEAA
jgi:repressor LexA